MELVRLWTGLPEWQQRPGQEQMSGKSQVCSVRGTQLRAFKAASVHEISQRTYISNPPWIGKERIYTSKSGSEVFNKPQRHEFRRNHTSKATDLKLNSTLIWHDIFLIWAFVILYFSISKRFSSICFALHYRFLDFLCRLLFFFTCLFCYFSSVRNVLSLPLTVTQPKYYTAKESFGNNFLPAWSHCDGTTVGKKQR